ncbi:MAG: hypothetical protein U1C46_10890 [Bacteroidales bacterium]|nr:hypothetical protein [Bacteroidales bacterium]MDZ4205307.1 hypothetical protein [Bacteroidales bacterium]
MLARHCVNTIELGVQSMDEDVLKHSGRGHSAEDVRKTAGVSILRLGLHPSEGLLSGEDLIAGPFHVSFGEMGITRSGGSCFVPSGPNQINLLRFTSTLSS